MRAQRDHFQREHVISGAFVFLLLGVFAVFATLMVLLSAQLYRATVEDGQRHNAQRVAESFLLNTVRRNDVAGQVGVTTIADTPMLTFTIGSEEESYVTYIYCHDGALREYFGIAGEAFELAYGETICPMQDFTPSVEDGLVTMRLTDPAGEARALHAALRCGEGEVRP